VTIASFPISPAFRNPENGGGRSFVPAPAPDGLGCMPRRIPFVTTSSWCSRVWREWRAGNLTRVGRDTLLTLHHYRGCGLVPSHRTLAGQVGCSVKSVQRALQAGRQLRLVSWCGRRVRVAWRSLVVSNRYVLTIPDGSPARGSTDGQQVRAKGTVRKKDAVKGSTMMLMEFTRAASVLPDLLIARRLELRRRWQAGVTAG
jgi:hypothetical protein